MKNSHVKQREWMGFMFHLTFMINLKMFAMCEKL